LRKRGFTWIELIVILIVLLLVGALATPVFLHAREAAGRSRCLSNLRSISAALQVYVASNSNTLPLGMPADETQWYPHREPTIPAVSDIDRVFWANAIEIEADSLSCPAVEGFPFNYNGYLQAVSLSRIKRLNETITVWEGSGKAGSRQSLPRIDCTTTNDPCGYFESSPTIAEVPAGSVWTHGRGANFLLLDGHATWRRLGQNAGVPTDKEIDPFRLYDSAGRVDGFWLDDDGKAVFFRLD
jgi:prepilin-type processing-associated H-X9-DG protein